MTIPSKKGTLDKIKTEQLKKTQAATSKVVPVNGNKKSMPEKIANKAIQKPLKKP